MRTSLKWGFLGMAPLLGALACSGTKLNDVGDLNGGGSNSGGSNSGGSNGIDPNRGGAQNGGVGGGMHAAGSGQTAGRGGVLDPQGEGGQADSEPLTCPACVEVALGQDVRGIAVDDQRVFWVDHGTSDDLGNYLGNGRLLARDLDGGAVTVLASSLPGPVSVSVSSQYAYMMVDRLTELNHAVGAMRVPLAGGDPEPLQVPTAATFSTYRVFSSVPGYEYWNWGGAVYRVAETNGAAVETVLAARGVLDIFTDATTLYFEASDGGWTMPLSGGDPTQIYVSDSAAATSVTGLLLAGGYLYGAERQNRSSPDQAYLTRRPAAGGPWHRIISFPDGLGLSQLAVDGDRYYIDAPTLTQRQIQEGSLSSSSPPQTTLVSEAFSGNESWAFPAWQLSRVGIFFADARGLYLTPMATP